LFQLAQSIWLLSAAGILLPIIIHLSNVSRGKTLKIGSIFFIQASENPQAKRLKLNHLLLFILRCLLIIVMAILLAQPFYIKRSTGNNEKGWVLIEKDQITEAYLRFKPTIDSLIHTGFTFHYFNPDFTESTLEEALVNKAEKKDSSDISYWSLLESMEMRVPEKMPVFLFTNNQLNRIYGKRPGISFPLIWKTFTENDSLSFWTAQIFKTYSDSIRFISGRSSPSFTDYTFKSIAANAYHGETEHIYSTERLFIIYGDKNAEDAHFIWSALEAIKSFTGFNLKIKVIHDISEIPEQFEYLFWLSGEKLPASLRNGNIFLYGKGNDKTVHSTLLTGKEIPTQKNQEISLMRIIVPDSVERSKGKTIWYDGFGRQILSMERDKNIIYHFYSQFNPAWNGLVWNPKFPEILFKLLFQNNEPSDLINANDRRSMDELQLKPDMTSEKSVFKISQHENKTDLTFYCWLLAFTLFAVERILSFNWKKEVNHG